MTIDVGPRDLSRRIAVALIKFETATTELNSLLIDAEQYVDTEEKEEPELVFEVFIDADVENVKSIIAELEGLEPEESLQEELQGKESDLIEDV